MERLKHTVSLVIKHTMRPAAWGMRAHRTFLRYTYINR